MKIKPNILKSFSLAAAGTLLFPAVALAQNNPQYQKGDLVLYFQQEGGANTIYANLGNAALLFRGSASGPGAANLLNFIDINAALVSAFGAGWASDPTVYAGAAGVFSTSSIGTTVTDGDPPRTVYVSRQRGAVGTVGQASSTAWSVLSGSTGMSTSSSNIDSMNNVLENNYTTAVAVSPTSVSSIDNTNQNPFLAAGIQGNGFETFPGGVQQVGSAGTFGSFGPAGTVEFALDLYRILARTGLAGQVSGSQYNGSYEGTITINTSGQVSFISQGAASSAYDTWMGGFTAITAPADKLPTADPDGDGATNLQEFGFGGNPESGADSGVGQVQTVDADADTQKDLTLTLEVRSGTSFSPSGNDLVSAAIDEVVYRIEGSTDLLNWDSAVSEVNPQIGSGSPSSGYVLKTFRLNSGNGLSGKGFLRASVVK